MAQEKNNHEDSVFHTLAAVNCNEHTEIKKTKYKDKNGQEHELQLTYLSWAWAWHICKSFYPDAQYTIYESADGRPYFDDGRTAWVKTGVTIQGLEHIEYLPIMDHRNLSIPLQSITSMDMNKAIQRSLTKALARHGLGLYIYAGEDLPDAADESARNEVNAEIDAEQKKSAKKATKAAPAKAAETAQKPAAPARGSDEWNAWVRAVATKQPGKSGQPVDWIAAFKNRYAWDEDLIGCLEEDVFNFNIDNNRVNA